MLRVEGMGFIYLLTYLFVVGIVFLVIFKSLKNKLYKNNIKNKLTHILLERDVAQR